MASNQVVLTFAGDATPLERTFTSVGSSASTMSNRVDSASKTVGSGFDRMGSGAEGATKHFRGAADITDGLGTVLGATALGPIAGMAMGFADIADGLATTFLPAIQGVLVKLGVMTSATVAQAGATTTATGAQVGLNASMLANPIGLVVIAVAALVAGFILAWKHSETFRDVVKGAMETVGDAVGWVLDRFGDLWEFIRDLPGKITRALKGVATTITDMIPGTGIVKSIIGKIPGFAEGGVVGGPVGMPQLAVVHGGETITPPGRGGMTVVVNVSGVGMGRDFGNAVAQAIRDNHLIGVT